MNRRTRNIFVLLITSLLGWQLFANPEVRMEDKWRIREALEIRNTVGESIWKGISDVPFAILLVTDTHEFLFHHPYPSNDFALLEKDPITGSDIYFRKTQFSIHFEATFPAVNGLSCVVIGLPENTQSKTTSRWILTLLHENFHQFQARHPEHYKAVNALDLSKGDASGMWQLNYGFPYEDEKVNELYESYTQTLITCYEYLESPKGQAYYDQYQKAREHFLQAVSQEDRKYWSFQLWKEGIARYTEYRYLMALASYTPSNELKNLKDFTPFEELTVTFIQNQLDRIRDWKLSDQQRIVVYSLGMGEGILMDRFEPSWQESYTEKGMNLSYFE
ncbi:hypothetical protein POV27_19200 [Aureisphaera galaxeae]|uniref:hypothetical protein n=1 Tax=Aureisphaera galaxeae TaxID=1538023 RepID=UPI0023505A06|nr:hypothetical protein [Aureisphaera galaxeae]MDC8006188.1 hypothetical protein [Aureisphaera galaxeae]